MPVPAAPAEKASTTFHHGRSAALRGCFRVLAWPSSKEEEVEWLAGFDSVPADNRGMWPVSGPVPEELLYLADEEGEDVVGLFGVSPDKLASLQRIAESEELPIEEVVEDILYHGIAEAELRYLPLAGVDSWDLVRGGFIQVCHVFKTEEEQRILFSSAAGEFALYTSYIEEERADGWHKVENYHEARLRNVRRFGMATEISCQDAFALVLRSKVPPLFHQLLNAAGLRTEEKPASLLSRVLAENGLNNPNAPRVLSAA